MQKTRVNLGMLPKQMSQKMGKARVEGRKEIKALKKIR
jgi:hypothetical protein